MTAVFEISPEAQIEVRTLGHEQTPLIVIDHVLRSPQLAVSDACNKHYRVEPNDFYPGQRAAVSANYQAAILGQFGDLFKSTFGYPDKSSVQSLFSAYSMTDTQASDLKPIQMLPHFDSPNNDQLAMVHYLCPPQHGGTGFFRHKTTGIERVTPTNMKAYGQCLKQEAIGAELHLSPQYISKEHALFESIGTVNVEFNRLIVYPSNLLHSGLINTTSDLGTDPLANRLTISSFSKLS